MRSTSVVFCAIDNLIGVTHKALTGFPAFLEGLGKAGIPVVPVSTRSRLQLDGTIRKFGLAHPFIAEGGSGVYLPEDYFHLKPPRSLRLGRFTCIPVATPHPAAAKLLEDLQKETGVEAVALRELSLRELSQNAGVPQREAELLRQRDFDELFFFAGADESDIEGFRKAAAQRNAQVRPRSSLWSLAVGASVGACARDVAQLYQRAMRAAPLKIAVATEDEAGELIPACDRSLLLTGRDVQPNPQFHKTKRLALFSAETWPEALEAIVRRTL